VHDGRPPIPRGTARCVWETDMEDDSPMPDPVTRTERCCACGRPVWAPLPARDGADPGPPPELCDYCAAAR
jgi:hypothetical protein